MLNVQAGLCLSYLCATKSSVPCIKAHIFRAVTIYGYIDTYRYGLGQYGIDTLGCCIAILSDILLTANLVISNLKIYIRVHSILTV